jgi:hypothetical protein
MFPKGGALIWTQQLVLKDELKNQRDLKGTLLKIPLEVAVKIRNDSCNGRVARREEVQRN